MPVKHSYPEIKHVTVGELLIPALDDDKIRRASCWSDPNLRGQAQFVTLCCKPIIVLAQDAETMFILAFMDNGTTAWINSKWLVRSDEI